MLIYQRVSFTCIRPATKWFWMFSVRNWNVGHPLQNWLISGSLPHESGSALGHCELEAMAHRKFVDFPIKIVIFHSKMLVYQRVAHIHILSKHLKVRHETDSRRVISVISQLIRAKVKILWLYLYLYIYIYLSILWTSLKITPIAARTVVYLWTSFNITPTAAPSQVGTLQLHGRYWKRWMLVRWASPAVCEGWTA